jgi:hypothetical protein
MKKKEKLAFLFISSFPLNVGTYTHGSPSSHPLCGQGLTVILASIPNSAGTMV